jgi:hypothetical protein
VGLQALGPVQRYTVFESEDDMDVSEAKDSDIVPMSTTTIDTLWCPPQEGWTTLEQLQFQSPENVPDPLSAEDLALLEGGFMDTDPEDDFQ